MSKFTDKQRAFIEHYLSCWNATEAAISAGYSKKTARSMGCENLTKPNIREEIEKRMSELAMTANEVLFRLGKMARSSVDDIVKMDEKGHISLDFAKAKENGSIHLIKSIVPTAHGTKVELHDQRGALVDIGKHLGMFVNKIDHTSGGEKIIVKIVSDD